MNNEQLAMRNNDEKKHFEIGCLAGMRGGSELE
jgi:hypothetical protein